MAAFTVNSSGYEVVQMSFPFATQNPPTSIYWETWSGLTGTATGSGIIPTYNDMQS
jgi:hypothetical protein